MENLFSILQVSVQSNVGLEISVGFKTFLILNLKKSIFLAHSATHVVVYAQLHVEGKNEGFHGFVIQVRCPRTFQTLPGITIGDMGSKPGCWQGVENGWMEFKNHRAPLSALLNKGCDITPDGKYVTSFKSASEKQSVSLGTLSVGRYVFNTLRRRPYRKIF